MATSWAEFKPMIRTITWKCGHAMTQRLTRQNPDGATIPPKACPFCGRIGFKSIDTDKV